MLFQAASLLDAIRLAEEFRARGIATYFRGQTRTWPLVSSFCRLSEGERDTANERLGLFESWVGSVAALHQLASNGEAVLAVAQHYGIPTTLIDFSTDPKVAAYFASHPEPAVDALGDSCIICLSDERLKSCCEVLRVVTPEPYDLKVLTWNVLGLWRLEAQSGVFLDFPYDRSFEEIIFQFDRIIFPIERDRSILSSLIPDCDIYPTQKSDLEVLVDQYFMIERLRRHRKRRENWTGILRHVMVPSDGTNSDGTNTEYFGDGGLPLHRSWNPAILDPWLQFSGEKWMPITTAPTFVIDHAIGPDNQANAKAMSDQITKLLMDNLGLRSSPVRWRLQTFEGERDDRTLELVWNGVRCLPYKLNDIAASMAMAVEYGLLIAQNPQSRIDSRLQINLARRCMRDPIYIEIGMEDGSYTRGIVSASLLYTAIRDDFWSHLTESWRERIKNFQNIFFVVSDPRRLFVFDRLISMFCVQFVPTQVILRDPDDARLYNPARAITLGLP